MKIYYKFWLILSLFICSNASFASVSERYEYVQTKTINRVFNVNEEANLIVNNKYGNIKVEHWNKHQIAFEVTIEVSSRDQKVAASRLQSIDVKFNSSSNEVSASTELKSERGKKISIEIHYLVKIPKNAKVQLYNLFGDIIGNTFYNETFISAKYGNIRLGNLKHKTNRILMQYSTNSSINSINEAVINASYSTLNLENANNINMVFKYSDAVMHRVENLALEMHYGNLNLNQVNSVIITGNYSNHVLGSVKKLLSFSGNYGTMKLNKLLAGFDELVLKCNYYNASIGIDNNASFAFVSSSNYGDVTLPNGLQLSSSNHARNSHSYAGSKGIGGGSIALSFTYGNIKFN
ncbi:hypothetical protein ACF3NR_05485 [Vaginella massiliensis]|uniref:hypothetical protein n=1 Tax=Vaginella massiliensis TaxID=1816680 RepID=UPI0008388B61|nr:hypothetical protein [Vaginella massiliensis]